MSILQSSRKEVRFIKRQDLEEEARIHANLLRDQIRQYGIDCVYYKLNTSNFNNFKKIIDQNTILKRAYGYEINPDYTLSAHMITYAEMQSDIFQLNKYGLNPNVEIDFYFDRIQFPCDFASKLGQYKEYKIDNTEVFCDVPDVISDFIEFRGKKQYLSSHEFPYDIGNVRKQMYTCEQHLLSGRYKAEIFPYEYGKEYTIMCDPYEHTDFNVSFPVNSDLYRSLKYEIENDDYLETMIYLTYVVNKVDIGDGQHKNVLSGHLHGSILFYDINRIGKYVELIHPDVGDIVEIDFPDEKNAEKYEITESFDKQLTTDGLNPLLHKYIWKCKARRYVNSYEDNTPQTDEDNRIDEKHKYDMAVDEEIAKELSRYDVIDVKKDDLGNDRVVSEDAVYGGYDGVINEYDKMAPTEMHEKYDFIDDETAVDIFKFESGSKLITNGYELLFMDVNNDFYQITTNSITLPSEQCMFEQNLRWMKATDAQIFFINVEGESTAIVCDHLTTDNNIEMNLNSMYDKTLDDGESINKENENFFKFKGTKTYMLSDGHHLYAKLASNKQVYEII